MTLVDELPDVINVPFAAEAMALRNRAANGRALMGSQPRIVDGLENESLDALTWIFGRDGALTAMEPGERWWSGCSVPHRAAQAMFQSFEAKGATACLLAPTHSAQIRACLDLMERRQALFVVVPDVETLNVMLHCDDFSADIREHRLWLQAGAPWLEQMDEVLTVYPGLPTPSQFVRLPGATEEDLERYTRPAKQLFTKHASTRAELLRQARQSTTKRSKVTGKRRVCVIAPSEFRLWDDAGAAAASALTALAESAEISVLAFNSDDPLLAAPVALAQAAADCDAVVAANLYRSDLPGVVADRVTWITWLTSPRIVPFNPEHPRDVVLVADPRWQAAATAANWPAKQVATAAWPELNVDVPATAPVEPALAIVANTCDIDIDLSTLGLSSHRLLWSQIRHDVMANPFVVSPDADAYLTQCLKRHQIAEEGLDRARFVHELIVPAYQQALARRLMEHHLPVQLFGRGWNQIETFKALANGPVTSRESLHEILGAATALVHCWPTDNPHPVAAVRKPLVPRCTSRQAFVAAAWDRFSKPQAAAGTSGNSFDVIPKLLA